MDHALSRVFGVSRDVPLTYVERPSVDDKFRNNLARDKHIVVYGRSKQGKTCLHKKCLDPDQYIVIQCGANSSVSQIYAAVLKEAGATVTVTKKKATSGGLKLGVEFQASGSIPFVVKGKGTAKGEGEIKAESSEEVKYFEIDPSDPNDLIRILDTMNFRKFIMLEDFHYLSPEVQAQVAIDLKAFHEKSLTCCFIIVGVWLEPNRLVLYNGDLAGRLIPVSADVWTDDELHEVISSGEDLLNISFADEVREEIVQAAQGNVGLLQETCYRVCERNRVFKTQSELREIGSVEGVTVVMKELALEQAGRYQNLFRHIVDSTAETPDAVLRWVAFVLITASPQELISGLTGETILERIRERHPRRRNIGQSELHKALLEIGIIQHRENVQPIILDFDINADILRVADSGFMLYVEAIPEDELLRLLELEPTA